MLCHILRQGRHDEHCDLEASLENLVYRGEIPYKITLFVDVFRFLVVYYLYRCRLSVKTDHLG